MDEKGRHLSAIGMGAVAGARSLSAPALVAAELRGRGGRARRRRSAKAGSIATGLGLLALLEMAGDKAPRAPARTNPLSLLARAASGAVAGSAMMPRSRATGAALGAAAAVAATHLTFRLRRAAIARGVPNVLAGLLEDALVVLVGRRAAAALP